ncbi:MAG: glutamate-1-semialdehyde 2,1-aminomutase [Desulfobacteraceae bacterium]|nr:glutamate-1-semialdehyde 2,1-aminomutase [Desulfobacteraceae bacterium]
MNPRSSHKRSRLLYDQSLACLPGGVNSPVRAFSAVGGKPVFITRAKGAYLYDVDGNKYLDYVGSWGPAILGHAHPQVVKKVQAAAVRGLSFGTATELELTLARLIKNAFPSIEKLRLVNSGTEATMSAIRLARAYTGRSKIVKFNGCYHGHGDSFLVKAGSGSATFGIPDSAGISPNIIKDTISLPFNNPEAVIKTFKRKGSQVACIIVEPVAGNMGLVLPEPVFLKTLRELTQHYQALLIFDEVITGFRVAYGGAQAIYGITPDLTCLGKIIGGGLPIGAYGGRREIMEMMAPVGPVYQAGTLSGNPLVMTAGIETLNGLSQPGVYSQLEAMSSSLEESITTAAAEADIDLLVTRVASLLTVFFSNSPVVDFESAKQADTNLFARFFHKLLAEGVYWPPSQFEAAFVSLAHSDEDIQTTIRVIKKAVNSLQG